MKNDSTSMDRTGAGQPVWKHATGLVAVGGDERHRLPVPAKDGANARAMGRRRWLLAGGGTLLLAACGDVFDRDRIIVDDLADGAEIRLHLHQELEIRLAVNPSDGYVTYLRSRIEPELAYRSGPVYRDHDPRRPDRRFPIEAWVFTGREPGHATIRLEYARPGDGRPARVLSFRVDVLPWY
ncbi:MAG: protease inhibitor I42 family protein [Lautropia sp.]|nr:protease inhibitor I42 family protein [Lautropia sp.]